MNNLKQDTTEIIKQFVYDNKLPLDMFFTGSVAREEERKINQKIISDIDILVVLRNKMHIAQISKKLICLKKILAIKGLNNVSFILCLYKNLKKMKYSNYALSVCFKYPIIKMLPVKYDFYLYEKTRVIFELQSAMYYFSKNILTGEDVYALKTFLSLLKSYIYLENKTHKINYIKNKELISLFYDLPNVISQNDLLFVLECLHNGQQVLPRTYKDFINNLNCSLIEDILKQLNKSNIKICSSVEYFIKNKKFILSCKSRSKAIKYIKIVFKENLGIVKKRALI